MQTFETQKSNTASNTNQEQPFFPPAIQGRQVAGGSFSSPASASFFQARPHSPVQAKLQVNTPGDAYEQQADAVADQVMRMREGDAPIVQRMPLTPLNGVQRMCSECAAGHDEEKEVQRKESGGAGGHSAPPIVSQVLSSGGGQAMDSGTRQFMESRFGQDFSAVRIHTDSRAAESASAIQARAYTSGNNVVFGAGEYQPGSEGGRRLLSHELTHVVQQGGGNILRLKPVETVSVASDKGLTEIKTLRDSMLKEYLAAYFKAQNTEDSIAKENAKLLRSELISFFETYYSIAQADAEKIISTYEKNDYKKGDTNPKYNAAKNEIDRFFRVIGYLHKELFIASKQMAFNNFKSYVGTEFPKESSAFDIFVDLLAVIPYTKGIVAAVFLFAKKMEKPIKISLKTLRNYEKIKKSVLDFDIMEIPQKAKGLSDKLESQDPGEIEFRLEFNKNIGREILYEDIDLFVKLENFRKKIEDLLIELQFYKEIDLKLLIRSVLGLDNIPEILEAESIKQYAQRIANNFELELYKSYFSTLANGPVYYFDTNLVYDSWYHYEKIPGTGVIRGGGGSWNSAVIDRIRKLLCETGLYKPKEENIDSWLAYHLNLPQVEDKEKKECPSCHGAQREWESRQRFPKIEPLEPLDQFRQKSIDPALLRQIFEHENAPN